MATLPKSARPPKRPSRASTSSIPSKKLLRALQNPNINIAGICSADLCKFLGKSSSHRLSRQLRRLTDIGVIKRIAGTYRYTLTRIGRAAIAAACDLTQATIIPALA